MKFGHSADQAQSQAVTGRGSRLVEPDETFQDVVMILDGDTWPRIGDCDYRALIEAEFDVATFGCVFDRIVEQVGERLG